MHHQLGFQEDLDRVDEREGEGETHSDQQQESLVGTSEMYVG